MITSILTPSPWPSKPLSLFHNIGTHGAESIHDSVFEFRL